jgi:5-methylcytosine-specific restriction endonuclease McrA
MRSLGMAWCRGCKAWLPASSVKRQGACQQCLNAEERARYRTNDRFRHDRRQRVHARKRGIAPVPLRNAEFLQEMFGGCCAYCQRPADSWDHLLAVSKGGSTETGNIVPACISCNASKGDRDLDTFVMTKAVNPHPALFQVLEMCVA